MKLWIPFNDFYTILKNEIYLLFFKQQKIVGVVYDCTFSGGSFDSKFRSVFKIRDRYLKDKYLTPVTICDRHRRKM